jgi:hypothetical protein
MTAPDPHQLCAQHFADVDVADVTWWAVATLVDGVDQRWRSSGGEELTLFLPEPRSADALLTADTAVLLAAGTFRPGSPMREDHRLRGEIAAEAPSGPLRLDVAAVDGDDGARRITLRRPRTPDC